MKPWEIETAQIEQEVRSQRSEHQQVNGTGVWMVAMLLFGMGAKGSRETLNVTGQVQLPWYLLIFDRSALVSRDVRAYSSTSWLFPAPWHGIRRQCLPKLRSQRGSRTFWAQGHTPGRAWSGVYIWSISSGWGPPGGSSFWEEAGMLCCKHFPQSVRSIQKVMFVPDL